MSEEKKDSMGLAVFLGHAFLAFANFIVGFAVSYQADRLYTTNQKLEEIFDGLPQYIYKCPDECGCQCCPKPKSVKKPAKE